MYLNRERLRLTQTNDKGRVIKRKRYLFGDEVDTDLIEDDRVESFKEKGILVDSEDDLDRFAGFKQATGISAQQVRGQATTASNYAVGASGAGTPEAESLTVDPEPTHEDEPQGDGAATETSGDSDGEVVDEYSEQDYASLQGEAKSRGLNAGGSADDLRKRLREDDES
jgi:hypothetical protein